MGNAVLELITARRGHFVLESGHHGDLWLDLDSLFLRPSAVLAVARDLAARLAAHRVEAVVGPLVGGAFVAQMVATELDVRFGYAERHVDTAHVTYAVPHGFHAQLRGRRVGVVDDVMNAGSAARATVHALAGLGADPVAVGALLVLGETALPTLAASQLAVEYVSHLPNDLWEPTACPMCRDGVPLTDLPVGGP